MNIGMGKPWAVEVLSVGSASAGAVAWRLSGRLHVSAIVKATFSFARGAAMQPTLPVPVRTAEVRHPDYPEGSIREPLDTAPELGSTDVIFVGHACAPGGVPVPRLKARVAVRTRTNKLLVDKSLEVLGDRVFIPGKPPPEPAPFTRIPLVYERAYGGPDHAANPVGIGQFSELAGRRRLPNVVHPDNPPRPPIEPAGFAPISIRWPQRRRLLGSTPSHILERPIAEISGELDRSYFQSAPADQRARILEGDEWIVLEGLHPSGVMETQLPSARGVARVYLPNGTSLAIVLVADTLLIDGDAEQATITWRGSFPIPSEADLPGTAIAAGVELPGRPVPLPPKFPSAGLMGGFAPVPGERSSTVAFSPTPGPVPPPLPSPGGGRRATVALSPEQVVIPPPPLPSPGGGRRATVALSPEQVVIPPPLPSPGGGRRATVALSPEQLPVPPPPAPPPQREMAPTDPLDPRFLQRPPQEKP